jgi:hypothetical protein
MPTWVPPTLTLAYAGIVILMTLTAVFSETEDRRNAAYRVLLVLLPTGVAGVAAHQLISHYTAG